MYERRVPTHGPTAALLLGLLALPGWGAEPDTSRWRCQRCPFPTGQQADYSVGASYVSDDAARFGNATGYDEQGAYANLDGQAVYATDSHRAVWLIEDLGLDSRQLRLDGGRQGSYDYHLAYSELPFRSFDTTSTVFSEGADGLVLPNDWVRAGLTSGFTALDASLFPRNIESDRQAIELGGRYLSGNRIDFFADYRRSESDGVGIQGGSFFTNASLLPRPFDYQTDEIDVGLRYRSERGAIQLGYYGSFFENDNLALNWENPFNGTDAGALAEPPDSSFHQFVLSGNYRTGWYGTVVALSAAAGEMEQDDPLLAYTINPNIVTGPLPLTDLGGKVDTSNLALTLTARPHRRARVKLAYRYDDRDNKTPIEQWNRVIVDSFNSSEFEENVPYSFERMRLNLSADVDAWEQIRLSAGYDYMELDRSFQEVANQDEESGWGKIRWRPNAYVDVTAKGGTSRRDVDNYDTILASASGQNPLLRKYHLAYRYREFGELTVEASFPEQPISVSGTVMLADDSYTRSELGLLSADDFRFAADLNWAISPRSSLYINAGYDEIESEQAGSEFFQTPDWRASHSDEFLSFGAGVRVDQIGGLFDVDLGYTHGEGTSQIDVLATGGSGMSTFPDLESTLDSLRVRMGYRFSTRLEGNLQLRYEDFSTEDWALQGVTPAAIPEVLSLGAAPYDYDVFVIGIGVSYFLGVEEPSAGSN